MHIFLTGGAGYIGGTTCAALLQAGHQVTVYDNLSRGHRTAVPAGAHFIRLLFYDRIALGTGVQVAQPSAGKDEAAHQFDSGADRVGAGLSQ